VLSSESPLAAWAGSGPALLASLQAGDRVQGVIVVSGAGTAHHDARTLASIADVTALRLEQAQLHHDAAQHERELASHRERERIARDLHDTVLQTLVGISMQVGALQRRGQPVGSSDLAALQTALREQLLAMQGFVARLRHHDAAAVDLLAEVQALAHDVTRRGQRVSVTGGALEAIPATIAHELVFLIREVLASAQRRQFPADVAVHLGIRDEHLCARLHFDSRRSTRRESWLPAALRDRLALLGGHVRVTVQPRRGTTVALRVPYRGLAATDRDEASVPTVTARRASSTRRT
jgi:signal transduction histidine kinase